MATPCKSKVYTATELMASRDDLNDIINLVNLAYMRNDHIGFSGPRFRGNDEFLAMLGADGLCSVICSEETVLATSSLLPWRPQEDGVVIEALQEHRPNDHSLVQKGLSYELKAVATADTPESRGRGLVETCINELALTLSIRHRGDSTLLLWVQILEDQNGGYWRRRGYEQVGPIETKPKGTWGSIKDFQFTTLVKRISLLV